LHHPTNDGMVADRVHHTSVMHPQSEERTDLRADGEMPPIWRKHRRFHSAPPFAERRCDRGRYIIPQLGLVRISGDAVEQVDKRLESRGTVHRGKCKVDRQAGHLTDTKIVRMACPTAPQTGLGFDRGTKYASCCPHGNLFKQACSRYATGHQKFLERFLARHSTSHKLRWEDPFLGHGTLFQNTRPDVVAGDLALFGLWGEEGLSSFVAHEEFRFVSPLS
jgi:hypothetical protein